MGQSLSQPYGKINDLLIVPRLQPEIGAFVSPQKIFHPPGVDETFLFCFELLKGQTPCGWYSASMVTSTVLAIFVEGLPLLKAIP
jgi:hypothetical protein